MEMVTYRTSYTQLHKWLPEVNKHKFTHPTKLQVGVAIGGVTVEASLFIVVNNLWWICRILCESGDMLHRVTQYILHCLHFTHNTVSKQAVCRPYWCERGGSYLSLQKKVPGRRPVRPGSTNIPDSRISKSICMSA